MRNSRVKIRVTDAWFSEASTTATTEPYEKPDTDTPETTNPKKVEKNLAFLAYENQTPEKVEKNLAFLASVASENPVSQKSQIAPFPFVCKGGPKEKGLIEDLAVLASCATREDGPPPYLTPAGDLVIPFAAPTRYHWWRQGAMGIVETLTELAAPAAVMRRHMTPREFEAWALGDLT